MRGFRTDLDIGSQHGMLTILRRSVNTKYRQVQWECVCLCGKLAIVRGTSLLSGKTRSCGFCAHQRHGHRRHTEGGTSPTYRTWVAMRSRCLRPNHKGFSDYGWLGICKAWRESFEAFHNDMGGRPYGHTIDRIDSRFGYFPANCRWATRKQQTEGRRNWWPARRRNELIRTLRNGTTA